MRKKYLFGNDTLIELGFKDGTQIEIMMPVKGGANFYQIQSRINGHELDRRGGILLKTSGTSSGRMNEAGVGTVIYHRGVKINESKNFIGPHIS